MWKHTFGRDSTWRYLSSLSRVWLHFSKKEEEVVPILRDIIFAFLTKSLVSPPIKDDPEFCDLLPVLPEDGR